MSRSRILSFVVLAVVIALPLSADGPAIFKSKCAACHGQDGKGETAMGKKLDSTPCAVTISRRGICPATA